MQRAPPVHGKPHTTYTYSEPDDPDELMRHNEHGHQVDVDDPARAGGKLKIS